MLHQLLKPNHKPKTLVISNPIHIIMGLVLLGLDGKTYTTNSGQAAHPGDKGHKAIADRVISNFDF